MDNVSGDVKQITRRIGAQKGRITKLEQTLRSYNDVLLQQEVRIARLQRELELDRERHNSQSLAKQNQELRDEIAQLEKELGIYREKENKALRSRRDDLVETKVRKALGAEARFADLELDLDLEET